MTMKPASPEKKRSMKYGTILGAVAGLMIFVIFYTLNGNPTYLVFIPFAAAMGWASQYVKDEDQED